MNSRDFGVRTVYAYMPTYPEATIKFYRTADKSRNSVSKTFQLYELPLDADGRGSVDLQVLLNGLSSYTVEAPSGVTKSGEIAYSTAPLALFDWLVIGSSDYITEPILLEEGAPVRVYGRNVSGGTMTAGQAVKLDGSDSVDATFDLAQADSVNNARVAGIVSEDIANNEKGYVTVFGKISDIDTHALSEGFRLYLSPSTAGELTTAKPSYPNVAVEVAFVSRSHLTLGELFVNVNATSPLSPFADFARSFVAAVDAAAARTVLDVPATGDVPDELTDLDTAVTGAELDADHSKLAGIESSATADQTAGEILTAIKTVDGTGSGLDADLLDGVQGSVYYQDSDAVMSNNIHGGRKLYINKLDNALFLADKRWTVVGNIYNVSDDSLDSAISAADLANLFDGNYDSRAIIAVDKYAVVNINFSGEPTGYFPGYPYGTVFLSYYGSYHADSATLRVYCNYVPQGVGWKDISFTDFINTGSYLIESATTNYYNISEMEFKIVAGSSVAAWPKQIDFGLSRPVAGVEFPYVDKYSANNLYDDLEYINDATGTILKDRTTGTRYRLYVNSGSLSIESV